MLAEYGLAAVAEAGRDDDGAWLLVDGVDDDDVLAAAGLSRTSCHAALLRSDMTRRSGKLSTIVVTRARLELSLPKRRGKREELTLGGKGKRVRGWGRTF